MLRSTCSRDFCRLARLQYLNKSSIYPIQRSYSSENQPQKRGFIGNLIENIKHEFSKDKEMRENIKKFREEAQKLEESEALKKARKKFETIESETSKSSQHVKEQISHMKEKLNKTIEDAQKSEIGRKGIEMSEEFAKQAKSAAESIAKQSQNLGQNTAFKAVSEGVKAIKSEADHVIERSSVYKRPTKLRKRSEFSMSNISNTVFEPNADATGMELHKDSKWSQSWQNFKDNNQYVNRLFDLKTKFDESDNPVVRASRLLTDKIGDLFGSMFKTTEMSAVLTEICKVDPNFDKNAFLTECETDIIPNILEALMQGNLEILEDWCHESCYNRLKVPFEQVKQLNYRLNNQVLDIMNVDLSMGKIMEQGPVLVITFQAQQTMSTFDSQGKLIEGDPNQVIRVHYVWVLCRDLEELNPKAAWRLLDLGANSESQWM